jgi:hypothetical protein
VENIELWWSVSLPGGLKLLHAAFGVSDEKTRSGIVKKLWLFLHQLC